MVSRRARRRPSSGVPSCVLRMSVKRLLVTVFGGTILGIGLLLLVLPGPAFLVIPLGLAVLATEYVWARRWLKRAKNMASPRKAKRTARVLRQAFVRRCRRWRASMRRWFPWKRNLPPPAITLDREAPPGPPPSAVPDTKPPIGVSP